jgi:hypothetical protein
MKISIGFVKAVKKQVVSVGLTDATLVFFSDIFGPFVDTDKSPVKHCC